MVVLVTGASHAGKSLFAQRLLEQYGYPTLSQDLLKMGLIRSGQTTLTPEDDEELTAYLWPITAEIIKTAVENRQNLVVEGCYVPFDWEESFPAPYREEIRFRCLIMSEGFIRSHFGCMKAHACDIEKRLDDHFTVEQALSDNAWWLQGCQAQGLPYILIDKEFALPLTL